MAGRQSAETALAFRLISEGMTAYKAARETGLALSTIYRAQRRDRERGAAVPAVKTIGAALATAKRAKVERAKARAKDAK